MARTLEPDTGRAHPHQTSFLQLTQKSMVVMYLANNTLGNLTILDDENDMTFVHEKEIFPLLWLVQAINYSI